MNRFTLAHLSDLHLPFEPRLGLGQRFSKRQLSALSWRRRRHLHRPEILDALPGPREPIPCLCVPSSSALPSAWDQGARWHRLILGGEDERQVQVEVRRWSNESHAFVGGARYRLCLPLGGVASPTAATAGA